MKWKVKWESSRRMIWSWFWRCWGLHELILFFCKLIVLETFSDILTLLSWLFAQVFYRMLFLPAGVKSHGQVDGAEISLDVDVMQFLVYWVSFYRISRWRNSSLLFPLCLAEKGEVFLLWRWLLLDPAAAAMLTQTSVSNGGRSERRLNESRRDKIRKKGEIWQTEWEVL